MKNDFKLPPPSSDVITSLLDNLNAGFYYRHVSADGTMAYVFFNQIMKDLFRSEFVPASKIWEQDQDDNSDAILMRSSGTMRTEIPVRDSNGSILMWLVFFKKKIEDPAEKGGWYILTTVIDVTDRKNDEILLAKSRLNLKLATDAGKMSTWDLDVKKRIFTITNGLDIKENSISLEEHLLLRHYEENSDITYSDLLDVMSGSKERGEGLYLMKDEKSGEILFRKSFYLGLKEEGKVNHVIGATQDVTEMYRQREIVNENRDELHLALEAGNISAWTYNPQEKMFYTLYGKAVAGKGITLEQTLDILHPDDRDRLLFSIESLVSQKSAYEQYPYRFKGEGTASGYRYYDSRMKSRIKDGKVYLIIGTQRDITDEFIYKEQLEDYSMKTKMINEVTHSVLWDYDVDKHTLLTYSEKALMPNQSITLDQYLEFVHSKDKNLVKDYFGKADRRELDDFSFEIDLLIPGYDKYRRAAISGVAIKNENGEIVKYTGVRRDISELANLNLLVEEQNKMKELVVENVYVGLILYSTDYKVVWANEYAADSFPDALKKNKCVPGTPCEMMVNHICTRLQGECILRKAMETGLSQKVDRKYLNDTILELTAIPVFDTGNRCTSVLLKIKDVSENRKMLEAIKVAQEKAENSAAFVTTLMNKVPSPIFIVDPADKYKFVQVNEAFCKVTNLSSEDVIGKTTADLFGKATAKKYNTYDIMLANGNHDSLVSYEASLNIDNNEVTWNIHKSIIEVNGKKLIIAISSDITALKDMNKELEIAKEKALTADRLKSTFLANMSHEIRTPLNAIVGFSQLLSESEDKEEKAEFSKIISNNNQMLLRLISDILDISKIESGTTDLTRDLVDVSAYFNELTSSLALKATNPDVKFIVENPYKACYINMDKTRFGQVVTNFVTNALKYTQKGYVKVGYYIERHGITIKVEDTGVGIPASKRDRVFARFDKLDSMVQGTGLGLPIAKLLTETGGGKIWFESEEGKGTIFYSWKPFSDIRILRDDEVAAVDVTKPMEVPISKPEHHVIKRILVAEDNPSNFKLLQKILSNYEIDWAKDGIDVVEKVAKNRYDVVLMDIKMPIMNGLDATRQIRKFNSAIPIVAVTANAFAINKEEALLAGCNDFLAKPILKEDVFSVLAKI